MSEAKDRLGSFRCRDVRCASSFPRATAYCPYCGVSQSDASPTRVEPATQPPVPAATPAPVSLEVAGGPIKSPAPTVTAVPNPAAVAVAAPARATPRLPWGRVAAGIAIGMVLLLVASGYWRSKPSPQQLVLAPGAWTAVDMGEFRAGERLVISGDAPFRLRTADDPPVLVDASRASVDIGRFTRRGLELKAAGEAEVHVTVAQEGSP
jgi:hypothetical protein